MVEPQPNRAHGLDLLRGGCAIMVACYHVMIWKLNREMYSWGLHGVYIFFALSGTSLTLAYKHKFDKGYPITSFLLLRFARLVPLFALASAVMLAYKAHTAGITVQWLWSGLVSTSLLFGLGNPGTTSLVLGGWSLGIELVYYLIFTALLSFTFSPWRWAVAALLVALQVGFVELTLAQYPDFRAAWAAYTQPLAFVAYFFCGCLIGRALLLGKLTPRRLHGIIALALAALLLGLSGHTAIATLTGGRGLLLLLLSVSLVAMAAGYEPRSRALEQLSEWGGEISYGTYLLHPLVFIAIGKAMPDAGFGATLTLTLSLSLMVAWLLEHYFERPLRSAARRLIENPVQRTMAI